MWSDEQNKWYLRLNSELNEDELATTLWHETIHILMLASGIELPHDEEFVEELAQKLAICCPEILEVCKLKRKNNKNEHKTTN